jgi:hypothetical protein
MIEASSIHASPVSQPDVSHVSAPPLNTESRPRLSLSQALRLTESGSGWPAASGWAGSESESDSEEVTVREAQSRLCRAERHGVGPSHRHQSVTRNCPPGPEAAAAAGPGRGPAARRFKFYYYGGV